MNNIHTTPHIAINASLKELSSIFSIPMYYRLKLLINDHT